MMQTLAVNVESEIETVKVSSGREYCQENVRIRRD